MVVHGVIGLRVRRRSRNALPYAFEPIDRGVRTSAGQLRRDATAAVQHQVTDITSFGTHAIDKAVARSSLMRCV